MFLGPKKDFPKKEGRNQRVIYILFLMSLLFFVSANIIPSWSGTSWKEEMVKASGFMVEAMENLKECLKVKEYSLDEKNDINKTALIGMEFSSITTTVGDLEAKRTTTNPNFAGLLVFLLREAGLQRGDTIAVGASGSFPALIVAVLAAAKAMRVDPMMICSLGASQWGANNPNSQLLSMLNCLLDRGVIAVKPIAFSLGGESDIGEGMDSQGLALLMKGIKESGIHFLHEKKLKRNVEERLRLYRSSAGKKEIKAFVNIGGSWANMGIDPEILGVKPGLAKITHFPAKEKRGVLYEMSAQEIPVLHLLNINGLVQRYGLPWDPVPLPQPGEGEIYQIIGEKQKSFLFIAIIYLLLIVAVFFSQIKTRL